MSGICTTMVGQVSAEGCTKAVQLEIAHYKLNPTLAPEAIDESMLTTACPMGLLLTLLS